MKAPLDPWFTAALASSALAAIAQIGTSALGRQFTFFGLLPADASENARRVLTVIALAVVMIAVARWLRRAL